MVHLRTQHFCEYIRVRMEIRRGGVEGKKMQERVPLTIFNDIALTECIRIVFHAYASLPISPLFLLIISRVLKKKKKKSNALDIDGIFNVFQRYYLSKAYINCFLRAMLLSFFSFLKRNANIPCCYLYK